MTSTDRLTRAVTRVGLVVHPSRDVGRPRQAVLDWGREHDVAVDRLPLATDPSAGEPAGCDLIVAIGGDGTTLAAIRRAADAGVPVLGVACGSLGALTGVAAGDVADALERFCAGDWMKRELSALQVSTEDGGHIRAFNDIAVLRDGAGQLRLSVALDGALYARLAGDGCIVSTSVGSSAYTIAARGPLLHPAVSGFVFTPLPTHGGFAPPLVIPDQSVLELDVASGHGGGRIEVDGQAGGAAPEKLTVALAPGAATVVAFDGDESHLTGLRRRGIIADSPRILADDQRR